MPKKARWERIAEVILILALLKYIEKQYSELKNFVNGKYGVILLAIIIIIVSYLVEAELKDLREYRDNNEGIPKKWRGKT